METSGLNHDWFDDNDLFVSVKSLLDSSTKINDECLLKKLIYQFDKLENKEEVWEVMLDYIEPQSISENILMYFCEKEILISKISHMDLTNTCLKRLSRYSEEAYFTLAKRLFHNKDYSISEFVSLMNNCHYESVFLNIFLSEKIISFKGLIIHDIINNNVFLSDEFKALSMKIRYAKHLYCTTNEEEIRDAYETGDYIYMMAISQNTNTPCDILENTSKIKGVKYAHAIRKSSIQVLELKNMLHKT